jgi:SAM-dependent methyltransferase
LRTEETSAHAEPAGYDYDRDPGRFRANVAAVERYGLASDVHGDVARRLAEEGLSPALDLGCGEGRLVHPARAQGLSVVALDYSATMLQSVPGPRIRGDARRLPFRHASFGAVAALYMLYHLRDPREAIAESHRVLRPGGLFVACAPSRHNDPELAAALSSAPRAAPPASFDAENGPDMVSAHFAGVEVERWDALLVHLPDREALQLYLRGQQLSRQEIERVLTRVTVPLTLTKRGALIWGRRR